MDMTLPFFAATRPRPTLRPFKAIGHFRRLMRDVEDTAQVFYMGDCLPSKRTWQSAAAFCRSPLGMKLMATEPCLPDLLDDHDQLLAMPKGSVAHAYVDFMRREKLSAAGLVEASRLPGREDYADQWQWFNDRLRDTHDLSHILTGYGRDPLGEQCVLGFTSGQYFDLTETIIAWAGTADLALRTHMGASMMRAVAEARRNGKAAATIYKQEILSLLAEPLDKARARLGIAEPTAYLLAHKRLRERDLDPYSLGGRTETA